MSMPRLRGMQTKMGTYIVKINKLKVMSPEIKKIIDRYADSFKEQFQQHIGKRIDD